MTERHEFGTRALASCFAVQRRLFEAAATLSRELSTTTEHGYTLHLGASCMRIAADRALQSQDARETLWSWRECGLAERQIRLGTYRALKAGCIDNDAYDELFRLAEQLRRMREEERLRVRRQLMQLDIV